MTPSPHTQAGFLRFMAGRFLANFSKQMILLALMWQIFDLTSQPLMLGLIGLVQGVPFILGSLYCGHLVDRHEKKGLILISLVGLIACAGALAAVSHLHRPPVIVLYVLIAAYALCASLEMPAASSYLQILIPAKMFSKAAAWNLANYVGASVTGPLLAGFILERVTPSAVYGLSAGGIAAAAALTMSLRPILPEPNIHRESALRSIAEGLRFVKNKRIVFAAMALDSFAVLFGEVAFILPVFAQMLAAGPLGLGLLRAAPAVGSCATSLVQAVRPVIRIRWNWLQTAVLLFGVSIIAFGLSHSLALSLAMLLLSGAADGVSVIIRQSLYQLHTPDALRGRVQSVSGVFISVSNELGGFESGLAAQFLGASPTAIMGGVITLLTVGFIRFAYPNLEQESTRLE